MSIRYIADMHLFHENAILFDNRPFTSFADELEKMICLWNDVTEDTDEVKIVGDMFCSEPAGTDYRKILNSLKGIKTLIIGNHDDRLLQAGVQDCFKNICRSEYIPDYVTVDGVPTKVMVHISHFPYLVWNKGREKSYHVFGHMHNIINEDTLLLANKDRALNAGAMVTGFKPLTLDELIERNKVYKAFLKDGKRICDLR